MKEILKKFLLPHWDGLSPLLLGLSGGPDSRLLLHLLVELKAQLNFHLGVAHVDHRWRPTSASEALTLQQLTLELGLPFHLKTINPATLSGNLEAACRYERLAFFRELCQQHRYQAVLLAHHADDQSETVLKRLFEGSSLPYLGTLGALTEIDGLKLWRPLLSIRKKELLEELSRRSIHAFEDETNHDPRFLRARFRTQLLPLLSKEFGKEISVHLNQINQEALELNEYLTAKIHHLLSKTIKGPFGAMLELKGVLPKAAIEQRHLVHSFCLEAERPLSKKALYATVDFLINGTAGKAISSGSGMLYIDRYSLFATSKKLSIENAAPVELSPGEHTFDGWNLTVRTLPEKSIAEENRKPTDWRTAWQGQAEVILPSKSTPYTLATPSQGHYYHHISSLRKWWNNAKTPFFMRGLLPVIMNDGIVVHEFVSGRSSFPITQNQDCIAIRLKWKDRKV